MKNIQNFLVNKKVSTIRGGLFVDLGLPSKTLWAKCNIGAEKPEERGNLYSWGEIETKENYKWADCKLWDEANKNKLKYNSSDNLTMLEPEDDVAHCTNKLFTIPTKKQAQELLDNTNLNIITIDDHKYAEFTSKHNGNKLIIPFAGKHGINISCVDEEAYIWLADKGNTDKEAYMLNIGKDKYTDIDIFLIRYGCSIRPVKS